MAYRLAKILFSSAWNSLNDPGSVETEPPSEFGASSAMMEIRSVLYVRRSLVDQSGL